MTALQWIAVGLGWIAAFSWMLRARESEANLRRLSAELDATHLAGAAIAADPNSAAVWRKRALAALRAGDYSVATSCAAVAAHGAREIEATAGRTAEQIAAWLERGDYRDPVVCATAAAIRAGAWRS